MAAKKTLLIVDGHTLFREGLKTIISRNPAYEVVGETGRGETAIQMAKSLRPDLILADISLPDQSGIELTLQLRKSLPKTFIMMVTMHSKVDYIVKAFQAGATGFVSKDSAPERLLQAIDVVLKGEYFMDSAVSQKVVPASLPAAALMFLVVLALPGLLLAGALARGRVLLRGCGWAFFALAACVAAGLVTAPAAMAETVLAPFEYLRSDAVLQQLTAKAVAPEQIIGVVAPRRVAVLDAESLGEQVGVRVRLHDAPAVRTPLRERLRDRPRDLVITAEHDRDDLRVEREHAIEHARLDR